MRAVVLSVSIVWLLIGCAAHHEVRCDGKLEPINAPAPKVSGAVLHDSGGVGRREGDGR
jgi:hypothetical protein